MNNNDLRSYRILKKYKIISLVNGGLVLKDSGFKGLIKKIEQKIEKQKKEIVVVDDSIKKIPFEIGKIIIILDKDIDETKIMKQLEGKELKFQYFKIGDNYKETKNLIQITSLELNRYFRFKSLIMITKKNIKLDEIYFSHIINSDIDVYEKIERALMNLENLKLLGNYNNINNINVKASTFFDYEGGNYYSGGAERYLIDLHEVCSSLNCNLDIYQNANKPYFRKFSNINVIGLPLKDCKLNYSEEFYKKQADNYIYSTNYNGQLNIYSAFHECFPRCLHPALGISHGVSWDNKSCKANDGIDFWQNKKLFIESAQACDRLISVDTNTANWFQTIDYELGNQKFKVIPNYVDTKEFCPRKNYLKKKDKIVITYPRRLYEPRGLYLALEAADKILEKYENVEFRFVGKGFEEDLNQIQKYQEKWPNRILCYSKSPFEMHEVYKESDISLVPTLYSEGTSLSCLEAMASGNFVIASRIGGLTDLIINGYNGYLIEPTTEDFYLTIEKILENFDELSILRERAIDTAKAFNKDVWKERWIKELKKFKLTSKKSSNIDLVEFYIPSIENISKKTIDYIKAELEKNALVYLRVKKIPKDDIYSGNRLQLVSLKDEKVSKPARVYNGLSKDVLEIDCDKIIKL